MIYVCVLLLGVTSMLRACDDLKALPATALRPGIKPEAWNKIKDMWGASGEKEKELKELINECIAVCPASTKKRMEEMSEELVKQVPGYNPSVKGWECPDKPEACCCKVGEQTQMAASLSQKQVENAQARVNALGERMCNKWSCNCHRALGYAKTRLNYGITSEHDLKMMSEIDAQSKQLLKTLCVDEEKSCCEQQKHEHKHGGCCNKKHACNKHSEVKDSVKTGASYATPLFVGTAMLAAAGVTYWLTSSAIPTNECGDKKCCKC